MYRMWVAVHIDEHLVLEGGVIVLGAQFQFPLSDGDAHDGTHTKVPRLFLVKVLVDDDLSAAGQQIVVLRHHVVGAVAFSYGAPQCQLVIWRVFQMHARGDESTVDVAVVPSKSSHQGEQFSYLVGVLGVNARYGLVAAFRPLAACPWPVEMVVVEAHTCREAVMLVEVGLEHQRCIAVSLVGVVLLMSVQGILVVCGT